MRYLFTVPRWVLLACAGLIAVAWLDMLDLVETMTLLQTPGYAEANVVLSLAGQGAIALIKVLIPLLIGLILVVTYRRSSRVFRLVTLILWLAILPYAAVVLHNLLLFRLRP
jgi:hypothetical protein